MVLHARGLIHDEADLRKRCFSDFTGTTAMAIVDAARGLGQTATRKYSLNWDELLVLVDEDAIPIVYLMRDDAQHAVVFHRRGSTGIVVNDPLEAGPGEISTSDLRGRYEAGPRTVIVVQDDLR